MKNFIILLLFSFSLSCFSQSSVKKAIKAYDDFNYPGVINRLEEKNITEIDAIRKLACSYKMAGDYQRAEANYEKVVDSRERTIQDLFAFYQVLQMNEKYDEAAAQFKLIEEFNTQDKRITLFNANKDYLASLLKDNGQYKIKNLAINSKQQDFGVTYYKNQVVYTSSNQELGPVYRSWNGNNLPYLDLYISKPDKNGELKEPSKLTDVNKKYHEGPATFNKKGNVMLCTTNNYEAKSKDDIRKLQIIEYKLAKGGGWMQSIPFPFNNSEYSCGHPALSSDGNTLYFVSDMPGGKGGSDIYRTTRGSTGKWMKPENLTQLNTEGNEMFPFIHESGLFFFSSDGLPGLGGLDVFITKITNYQITKYQISNIVNAGAPINSSKDDFSMALNAEKTKGYFSSNREGGMGDDDIYSYTLLKPFQFDKSIKGIAQDKDGNILAKTVVNLFDSVGAVVNTFTTTETGAYSFDVANLGKYSLSGKKNNYIEGKNVATVTDATDFAIADLVLEKDPGFSLFALVTDAKSKAPLEGVKLKIIDEKGAVVDYVTTASGDYKEQLFDKKIGDKLKYSIELSKDGYISKTVNFAKVINKPGEIKVNEGLDLSLGKMELGSEIGKLININPIYFDVNKSDIRQDAALELDKIVKAMNQYPGMVVELGSHTDCRSSKAYNASLSDRRAKSSAAYIVSKGIPEDRIYGKGYGESKLINGCACEGAIKSTCTEEEHQANRRTEFVIVKLKS